MPRHCQILRKRKGEKSNNDYSWTLMDMVISGSLTTPRCHPNVAPPLLHASRPTQLPRCSLALIHTPCSVLPHASLWLCTEAWPELHVATWPQTHTAAQKHLCCYLALCCCPNAALLLGPQIQPGKSPCSLDLAQGLA